MASARSEIPIDVCMCFFECRFFRAFSAWEWPIRFVFFARSVWLDKPIFASPSSISSLPETHRDSHAPVTCEVDVIHDSGPPSKQTSICVRVHACPRRVSRLRCSVERSFQAVQVPLDLGRKVIIHVEGLPENILPSENADPDRELGPVEFCRGVLLFEPATGDRPAFGSVPLDDHVYLFAQLFSAFVNSIWALPQFWCNSWSRSGDRHW
jgi:hypothetical protein